jgi:peptide/nickel transport system ATP-binding protein
MTAPTGPRLQVSDLQAHFDTPHGPLRAVDGVSFVLDRGRTLGVVGESGSGKSVLARSIIGLLPQRHLRLEGSVIFEGQDLTALPPPEMRRYWGREIAMVLQDPMTSLNPVMKVGSQVAGPLRHHLGMNRKEATEEALALLRSVGIPEPRRRLDEYPHELSGGMRQRIVIAIALACGPKLLLADEPTTALDVTVQAQILNLLGHLQRERDMAMILITHDLGVAAGRADDIVVMYAGQVVEQAPVRALFTNTRSPYTAGLLRSAPKIHQPSHSRLQPISGQPPNLTNLPGGCRFAPRCANAQRRCHAEQPPLTEAETPGHRYRCWYPLDLDRGIVKTCGSGFSVDHAASS